MHDVNVPFTCLQETNLQWSFKSVFAKVKIHKTLVKLLSFFILNLALCMAAAAFQDSCVSVSHTSLALTTRSVNVQPLKRIAL